MATDNSMTFEEVQALLAGGPAPRPKSESQYAACDNCGRWTHELLEFTDSGTFEMPVVANSRLALELWALRQRLSRHDLALCYACVDALEEPGVRNFTKRSVVPFAPPTPVVEQQPRLFAVE
jgi:hypothetical protein